MALSMHPKPRRPLSGSDNILLPLTLEARKTLRELVDILTSAGAVQSVPARQTPQA